MYSVNLLPQAYQNNAKSQTLKNRLMYGIALLLLVLFGVFRMLDMVMTQQTAIYNSLLNENVELQKVILSLKSNDPALLDSTQISTVIDQITASSKDMGQLLVKIANSAPEDVKITYFNVSHEESGFVAVIQASAEVYPSVSEWTRSLSQLEEIGEITISSTTVDSESEDKRINFELRVPMR